jgi:hypothetical protein
MGIINRLYSSFRRADDRYFRTRNLHLATVLFSRGFALVNVDRTDPANCEFVFRRSYDLEDMIDRFNSKKPIYVDARKLIYSWKTLRAKINDQRF